VTVIFLPSCVHLCDGTGPRILNIRTLVIFYPGV